MTKTKPYAKRCAGARRERKRARDRARRAEQRTIVDVVKLIRILLRDPDEQARR